MMKPCLVMVLLATTVVACAASSDAPDTGGGSGGSGTGGAATGSGGVTGGSGGAASGGSGGMVGGSGGAAPGDVAPDGPSTETGGGGPAAALNGFVFAVECPAGTTAGNCSLPEASRKKMMALQFGGDPNVTYKVTLHFCGPVEAVPYMGCASMQSTYMCVDGMRINSGFNATYPTYEVRVANPAHSYFLNNRDLKDDLMKIDYSITIDIKGGSAVTYLTDGGGNADVFTSRIKNHNYTCPGVPGLAQPFAGQFVYTTVESVTP